jgi:hypothetical protein
MNPLPDAEKPEDRSTMSIWSLRGNRNAREGRHHHELLALTSPASVVVVVSEGDFALTRVNSVRGKEVVVKRLASWSVLQLFVLSVVISGLPATGIAQTRTPVILFPGYISTKLLVTVENQTVAPDCPASGTFGSWVSSDQSNGFSPACRDKL